VGTLALVSTALGAGLSTPAECDEERASCREGCTLAFTSQHQRPQLTRCLDACTRAHTGCIDRWLSVNNRPLRPARDGGLEAAVEDGGVVEGEVREWVRTRSALPEEEPPKPAPRRAWDGW
jgi:hypothetical protein